MSRTDERTSAAGLISANASPQHNATHKSHSIFALLSKRSIKVEPYPLQQQQQQQQQQLEQNIAATQRCNSAELLPTSSRARADVTFAKCQLPTALSSAKQRAEQRIKSQTLPSINYGNANSANGKPAASQSLLRLNQLARSKSKAHVHRHSAVEAGSLSDGGEIALRQSPAKQRSANHNRFSHQFSLCCKAEKKPMTPPVTVRYNSIPDTVVNALRRDDLSLSWTLGSENLSLSLNSSNAHMEQPLAAAAKLAVPQECASAPESPVTSKSIFNEAHSSPSNLSQRSVDVAVSSTPNESGPIRPIAVSACRSRLRLKLFPPGTELTEPLASKSIETATNSSMKRATTPQHMSSPNISTERCVNTADNNCLGDYDVLPFISHENIQIQRQTSGTGLARQTLLAAQMLSLIPAEEARERSFLEGRLGSSSLLGPSELTRVLPNSEVTVFVGTWNMNGQSPPQQMNDFVLPATVEHVPDLVAIGTQESSPDRFEWEVTLQETLGPSHVLFHSTTLGTLHLAVYMRRDLIWYCSAPEDASMSVRTGSAFRTKGAVAISFCLFGTSMLFVTSHLTAHQQKVKERVSDVKRIIHALDLPKNLHMRYKNKDVTQNFDNVFWCGDLNFRLAEPREKLLDWIQNTKFPLPSHLPHGYMHTDQLSSVLAEGAAFRGFMEANITFPPTYKYDPGTQHFDTSSKQRAPAYTDRILYKYRQNQGLAMRRQSTAPGLPLPAQQYVQCLLYDSVPSITTSDHKPVWALFRTIIRAGTDSIPLAAGLFSRDIYLEGMKRRLNNQYSGSSAVCAIQ